MKKLFKLSVLLLLCCSTFNLFSQVSPISILKSEISKDKKKLSQLLFTSDDGNGGIVVVREYSGGLIANPQGYYIEHYNNSLELLNETEIKIDDNSLKNMLVKDGKVHLIEFSKNNKEGNYNYNILTSNLNEFEFSTREIFSIDKADVRKFFGVTIGLIPITNAGRIDHDPTGEVSFSKNKKFITFNFDIKDNKQETHRVLVYNDQLEKVFEQELKQDVKDRLFDYNSITTSDIDGSVYFLGKSYEGNLKIRKKAGKANYTYQLWKINGNGQKKISFSTEENFVASLETVLDESQLVCVGFYSEKNDRRYKGTVYYKINPETLAVEVNQFNPFTEQFMVDKYGEKRGKRKQKKGKELRYMTYRGLYMNDDGSVVFNAEEFYIVTQTHYGMGGMMATTTTYHYDDILSCKIDKEGKMAWARNINKKQATTSKEDYLSYTSTNLGGKVFIFLNGSDKIKKMRDDRIAFKQVKTKKMNLYAIEIDEEGNFNFQKIIDDKDSKVTYKVSEGIVSKDSKNIMFEGAKGKKKRVLKLTL